MRALVVAAMLLLLPSATYGQSFSCPIGKQAACLDYGDRVCDSLFGKRVDQNAVCFSRYTCDYKGFVCKSEYDDLSSAYDNIESMGRRIASSYDDFKLCVVRSTDMDDIARCITQDNLRL
jgi:hypothetical protein